MSIRWRSGKIVRFKKTTFLVGFSFAPRAFMTIFAKMRFFARLLLISAIYIKFTKAKY